ncbi:MAG TPA: RNA polymerase sigma factor [Longimicrobium sp.]|nr:RNA polymerase sigma factor [Longimicrobium sp.]
MDEAELVRRARGGDPAAQRRLYDAHVERVYRLAYRLAGSDDAAREYTQDTFLRAFTRLADFRGESAFGTWLHAVAVSVCLNGVRKAARRRAAEAPLEDAAGLAAAPEDPDPRLRDDVRRALGELPEGWRVVVLMHDVEGYTHEEIGAALGVPPGTSRGWLSRARARLRGALAAYLE